MSGASCGVSARSGSSAGPLGERRDATSPLPRRASARRTVDAPRPHIVHAPFMNTLTLWSLPFVTARSTLPSPLKSPAALLFG